MPRDLILGTAGHIDHGKTSLVKALTGIDCDRLPEEKRRGITIDIGFATLDLGEFRLGIVDVPGHERFIKNMLAGATGIDLAMLVVAADDSIMPQTREHLEILRLLGLRHGLIALTKCDLVDETTREVVELEIRDLVQGTFLENAPILRTSANTGEGIPELKAALADTCRRVEQCTPSPPTPLPSGERGRGEGEWFRMPIDRSFIVQGYGTVVTGSVTSGSVRVGEEVEWQPRGERVRVRSLQNHGQPVEEVHRGMRAAINLAGIHHENVVRGQELAAPSYLVLSRVLTVRLHCLAGARRAIKHRLPARLHLGTAEIMGMVALLDCDRIEPGGWGLAQLFLEGPATAVWGQPFVLRDASAEQTLGGGQVLQPVARKFRRRHLEMIERIERLWSGDTEQRALTVAWFAGPAGVKQADLVRGAGLGPEQARELLDRSLARGDLYEASPTQGRADALIHAEVIRGLEENILAVLRRLHEALPLLPTHDRQKVQAQFASVGNDALVHVTVDRLLLRKRLVGDLRRIALAEFKPKLSANLLKLKDKVVAAYQEAGLKPPKPRSFIPQAGSFASSLDDLFALCVAEGWLVHIKDDFYLHRDAESQMRRQLTARLAQGPGMTVGEIRDFLGAGRVNTVVMCEYLDRLGITRREGEVRILVK